MNRHSLFAALGLCTLLAASACTRGAAPADAGVAQAAAEGSRAVGSRAVGSRAVGVSAVGVRADARTPAACLTFAGDVMLSRGVASRLEGDATAPWAFLGLSADERWVANLEGTLAADAAGRAGQCGKRADLCFAIAPQHLERLRGGPFAALSLANNHALDFGEPARQATAQSLRVLGIAPLVDEAPPARVLGGGREWALVALNFINREPAALQRALEAARLSIGLARARTPLVAVLPHWGREYDGRVWPPEEGGARLFRAWGAALVAGAHTHVVGESRCEADAALYFGLGNALFDQRSAAQRRGLAVRCCPGASGLSCRSAPFGVDEGSLALRWLGSDALPVEAPRWGAPCVVAADPFTDDERRAWQRHPGAARFVFVQPFRSLGARTFFALHRSHSTFDDETALRPYVFRMEAGGHRDLWSGTALSRPLVAARLFVHDGQELLCALHRADTFLALEPATLARVRTVYRWSGFGFVSVRNPAAEERCRGF